ncbi:LacI family DNA-binding transcriptional regulator [Oryzibacter oryziterrae]|uniref:LacI family DNA-binding transcriptional regulator n=1 Tax=Oryzibacter oryziterrae TaxID=2766474 RepID=UPI001F258D20|nr:LacI family DNA-binding transcriptional regulator [Oryzibacter oryziterrae]
MSSSVETPEEDVSVPGRITIRDVAKAAGVSIATASKALNDRGRMTPETRARIQTAARDLGFTPNAVARALVSQRSFTIGLLTNDTYGRFTLPVAAGLSAALIDRGVSVFLCAFQDDPEAARVNLRAMQDKCVDGLIIAGKRIDRGLPIELPRLSMPVVHVYSLCGDDDIGFMPDDRAGAALAVQHLIGLGRRRIAHVTGPLAFAAVAQRTEGWADALKAHGLAPFGAPLNGTWSEGFGYSVGQAWAALPPSERPDGVFCGNDQIARGVIDALTLAGLNVPRDISVVGFDNWSVFAEATRPPLTTIDMNLQEMGRQAGLVLLDMVEGLPVERGLRRLPCRLVTRQSCGVPPPA